MPLEGLGGGGLGLFTGKMLDPVWDIRECPYNPFGVDYVFSVASTALSRLVRAIYIDIPVMGPLDREL